MLANSTAAAKKTDQPGIWEMQKSYLLNPENSKTFLILSQPKMCQKCIFLFPRAHFLEATHAPTEPAHENFLQTLYCRPLSPTLKFSEEYTPLPDKVVNPVLHMDEADFQLDPLPVPRDEYLANQ